MKEEKGDSVARIITKEIEEQDMREVTTLEA